MGVVLEGLNDKKKIINLIFKILFSFLNRPLYFNFALA